MRSSLPEVRSRRLRTLSNCRISETSVRLSTLGSSLREKPSLKKDRLKMIERNRRAASLFCVDLQRRTHCRRHAIIM